MSNTNNTDDICHFRLNNGLRVHFQRDLRINSCVIHLRGHAGSKYETYDNIGAAHALEHWLVSDQSTNNRGIYEPVLNIKSRSAFNAIGSKFIAVTSRDDVLYGVHVLKEDLHTCLSFIAHLFLKPAFDKNIFAANKKLIKNEITRIYDSPEKLITRYAFNTLFPNTRYAYLNTGNPKQVERLTAEKTKDFYKTHYLPSNFLLVVYGNFDLAHTKAEAIKIFDLKNPNESAIYQPHKLKLNTNSQQKSAVYLKSGINNSYIRLDYLTDKISGKNFELSLLAGIILNTQIKHTIQNQKKLVYKLETNYLAMADFGLLTTFSVVPSDKLFEFIRNFKKCVKNDFAIVENHLGRAKKLATANLTFLAEKPSQFTAFISEGLLHGKRNIMPAAQIETINLITPKQLSDFISKITSKDPYITILTNDFKTDRIEKVWNQT